MFKRLLNKPLTSRRSFFLFGPRGTGKTTWLKHHKVLPIASTLRNLSRTLGKV